MNWWNVLEIPYDSDLKSIKKAYANLLKVYSPEDDAEGYQRLREAYDNAVKYAKRRSKQQKNQEAISHNSDKNIIDKEGVYKNEESEVSEKEEIELKIGSNIFDINYEKQAQGINLNESINQFMSRLNEIYNDVSLRTNITEWKELFDTDVMWNAESFPIIEDEMLKFLMNHRYLPEDVWILINSNFNWSKNEIELYNRYSAHSIDELVKNLRNPSKLNFDNMKSLDSESVDKYFYEKEQKQKAVVAENENEKKDNSLSTKDIFKLVIYIAVIISVISHGFGHTSQNAQENNNKQTVVSQNAKSSNNKTKTQPSINQDGVEDDRYTKVCITAESFKSTKLRSIISIHLSYIIPLDLYCFKDNTIGTCSFYSKKDMDEKDKWKGIWIRVYAGTIDGMNIMFLDKDFSKNSIDSDGGYTVKGSKKLHSGDEFTSIATEEGQSTSEIKIYQYYIDNFID